MQDAEPGRYALYPALHTYLATIFSNRTIQLFYKPLFDKF